MLSKTDLTKAVTRFARRHNHYVSTVRTVTSLQKQAILEWKEYMAKRKLTLAEKYKIAKEENPSTLMIFKVGDFYEMFFDDAKEMSKLLGLTLITRGHDGESMAMTGFPYHQLGHYIAKINNANVESLVIDN